MFIASPVRLNATFTWKINRATCPISVNQHLANPNYPLQVFAGTDWGLYYTDDITRFHPPGTALPPGCPR
jgi:hypothetical protein